MQVKQLGVVRRLHSVNCLDALCSHFITLKNVMMMMVMMMITSNSSLFAEMVSWVISAAWFQVTQGSQVLALKNRSSSLWITM